MHGSFKKEAAMEVDFSQIMMLQFFHMKVIYTYIRAQAWYFINLKVDSKVVHHENETSQTKIPTVTREC